MIILSLDYIIAETMYRFKQLTLVGGDLVCLYGGLILALFIRHRATINDQQAADLISPMSWLFLVAIVIIFIAGLYDLTRLKRSLAFYQKIFITAIFWAIVSAIFFYIFNHKSGATPKTILALTTVISFGLIATWRTIYIATLSTALWRSKIIFAGLTAESLEMIEFLQKRPELGYQVIGVISPTELPTEKAGLTRYPDASSFPANLADVIVVSPQFENDSTLTRKLYENLFTHLQVENLGEFYEKILKRVPPFTLSETWFLTNLQEQNKRVYDRSRILLDYLGALGMSIIFGITYPLVAILIKISSNGPIFFRQIRVGKNGKNFTLIKYRTMQSLHADGSAEMSGPQFASAQDSRITVIGKFLRLTRIDELPQFINILKNDMALIGPRPERPEFAKQLTEKMPYYAVRHLIKPGLTGWAQLQHNYYGTLDENLRKLEYDLYYIKNRGALLDLAIVLRTVNVILGMKGR